MLKKQKSLLSTVLICKHCCSLFSLHLNQDGLDLFLFVPHGFLSDSTHQKCVFVDEENKSKVQLCLSTVHAG